MKLKKIVSLALAGVMAVSMLAGCNNGGNSNSNNNGENTVSSVITAVNNGQSIKNKVKVTFTSDSTLEDIAEQTVAMYGDGLTVQNLTDAITKQYLPNAKTDYSEFYSNESNASPMTDSTKENDGETHTYLNVTLFGSSPASESYILNAAAGVVNNIVAKLDDTNKVLESDKNGTPTKAGEHYQDYSYTGNVCVVTSKTSSGLTTYYLITVVNQTVTDHVLEK